MKRERKQNWRLKKTLSRRVDVRAIEQDDLKYLWAAYKKGGLPMLGDQFAEGDMSADEFKSAFDGAAANFNEGWVISVDVAGRGLMPSGVMLGNLGPLGAYLVIAGAIWFPWASRRNIIEGTVGFLNLIRKEMPAMFYARAEHKRLYEVVCMHGILRRVGTSFVVFPDQSAAVFETKA